jgi:hypothetical protein
LGGIKKMEALNVVADWWMDKNEIFFFSFQREKGGERSWEWEGKDKFVLKILMRPWQLRDEMRTRPNATVMDPAGTLLLSSAIRGCKQSSVLLPEIAKFLPPSAGWLTRVCSIRYLLQLLKQIKDSSLPTKSSFYFLIIRTQQTHHALT